MAEEKTHQWGTLAREAEGWRGPDTETEVRRLLGPQISEDLRVNKPLQYAQDPRWNIFRGDQDIHHALALEWLGEGAPQRERDAPRDPADIRADRHFCSQRTAVFNATLAAIRAVKAKNEKLGTALEYLMEHRARGNFIGQEPLARHLLAVVEFVVEQYGNAQRYAVQAAEDLREEVAAEAKRQERAETPFNVFEHIAATFEYFPLSPSTVLKIAREVASELTEPLDPPELKSQQVFADAIKDTMPVWVARDRRPVSAWDWQRQTRSAEGLRFSIAIKTLVVEGRKLVRPPQRPEQKGVALPGPARPLPLPDAAPQIPAVRQRRPPVAAPAAAAPRARPAPLPPAPAAQAAPPPQRAPAPRLAPAQPAPRVQAAPAPRPAPRPRAPKRRAPSPPLADSDHPDPPDAPEPHYSPDDMLMRLTDPDPLTGHERIEFARYHSRTPQGHYRVERIPAVFVDTFVSGHRLWAKVRPRTVSAGCRLPIGDCN
jgi:hypothetical protein